MKKESKKKLFKIIIMIVTLLFTGVLVIRIGNIGATSVVSGELRDINKNTIVFDSRLFVHKYVHIMIESTDGKKIEDGLEFEVINPKGEKVISGALYDNEVFREKYKNITGEWKIVLRFKDNSSSSMINVGFAVNSKEENNMRIE